jgi:hypothetical protein
MANLTDIWSLYEGNAWFKRNKHVIKGSWLKSVD